MFIICANVTNMLSTKRHNLLKQASALKEALKIEPSLAKHPKILQRLRKVFEKLSSFTKTSL